MEADHIQTTKCARMEVTYLHVPGPRTPESSLFRAWLQRHLEGMAICHSPVCLLCSLNEGKQDLCQKEL